MNTTLISICIPTYNGQKFLKTCLDSAIGQTYPNIEIIIVDDCSTDKTYEIAKSYSAKDPRIRLYRNEKNIGLVQNWNKCMEYAKGEWLKFLFQDDYLTSDCIEVMVNSLSGNDKIVTSGRRLILDESLDEATKNYSVNETLTFERLGIVSQLPVFISAEKISAFTVQNICMNFIGEPTVIMFKKDITKELGVFNADLIQICDLEYFLRIACNYGIKYIPQPLTYFRVHKGSAGASNVSERAASMLYIDPIIMIHQLLYDKQYKHFRESLTVMQKIKLKLFFITRVNEAYTFFYNNSSGTMNKNKVIFESATAKYPVISRYKNGSLFIKLILQIVKLKRRVNKI